MSIPQVELWPKNAVLATEHIPENTQLIPANQLAFILGSFVKAVVATVADRNYRELFDKTMDDLAKDFSHLKIHGPLEVKAPSCFTIPLQPELSALSTHLALGTQDFPWIEASCLSSSSLIAPIITTLKKTEYENCQLLFKILNPHSPTFECLLPRMIDVKIFIIRSRCMFATSWEQAIHDWSTSFEPQSPYSTRIGEVLFYFSTFACLQSNEGSPQGYLMNRIDERILTPSFQSYLVDITLKEMRKDLSIPDSFSLKKTSDIFYKHELIRQLVLYYVTKVKVCAKNSSSATAFLQKSQEIQSCFDLLERELSSLLENVLNRKLPQQTLEEFLESFCTSKDVPQELEGYLQILQFCSSLKWYLFFSMQTTLPTTRAEYLFHLFFSSSVREKMALESNSIPQDRLKQAIIFVEDYDTTYQVNIEPKQLLALCIHVCKKDLQETKHQLSNFSTLASPFIQKNLVKRLETILDIDGYASATLLTSKLQAREIPTVTEEQFLEAVRKCTKIKFLQKGIENICVQVNISLSFDEWVRMSIFAPEDLGEYHSSYDERIKKVDNRLKELWIFTNEQQVRILLELLRKDTRDFERTRMGLEGHIAFLEDFTKINPLPLDICYSCLVFHDLDESNNFFLSTLTTTLLSGLPTKTTIQNLKYQILKFEAPQYPISPASNANPTYRRTIGQFGLLGVVNWNSIFASIPAISIQKLPWPTDPLQNSYVTAATSHWKYTPGYHYHWGLDSNEEYVLTLSITRNLETLETVTESIKLGITKSNLSQIKNQDAHEVLLKYYQGDDSCTVGNAHTVELANEIKVFSEEVSRTIHRILKKFSSETYARVPLRVPLSEQPCVIAAFGDIYKVENKYSLLPPKVLGKIKENAACFSFESLGPYIAQKTAIFSPEHSFTISEWFLENDLPILRNILCSTKKTSDRFFVSIFIQEYDVTYELSYPLVKEGCEGILWSSEDLCRLVARQVLLAKSRVYKGYAKGLVL